MKGASILNDGGVQSVFSNHYFLVSIGNLSPNDVDYFGIIYHHIANYNHCKVHSWCLSLLAQILVTFTINFRAHCNSQYVIEFTAKIL